MSVKGIHWEGNNSFFENNSFKQMAVARSIFTLDGGVQLIWAAFGPTLAVIPLKVTLGLEKFEKKLTWLHTCDYFFEMPKNQIFLILMQLLMVPLSWADQKLPKTIEPPI